MDNGQHNRPSGKPQVKKVNILLHVGNNTNPQQLANTVEEVIKELEIRGITASYRKGGVTVDVDGKAEE